jgi:hypothetical protein
MSQCAFAEPFQETGWARRGRIRMPSPRPRGLDPPEVAKIAGDQGRAGLQDDRRDPQIHFADVEIHLLERFIAHEARQGYREDLASVRAAELPGPAAHRPGRSHQGF